MHKHLEKKTTQNFLQTLKKVREDLQQIRFTKVSGTAESKL